jgi:hypothetical protein
LTALREAEFAALADVLCITCVKHVASGSMFYGVGRRLGDGTVGSTEQVAGDDMSRRMCWISAKWANQWKQYYKTIAPTKSEKKAVSRKKVGCTKYRFRTC